MSTQGGKPMRRQGGPGMGVGMGEKTQDFKGSSRGLVGLLRPERTGMTLVLALTVCSVMLSVAAPRILGRAVDAINIGAIGGRLPVGATKASVVEGLRAQGQTTYADMLARLNLVPGVGIDFGLVGRTLLIVLGCYVLASGTQLVQARVLNRVIQRTMNSLRRDVDGKVGRVPLAYLDGQPRGELLSRVTNDIDNIGQSMQQTLSQLLVNGLTVLGVIVMMLTISWWLTLIVMIAIPLVVLVTRAVMKRSQRYFVAQWKHTGELNAQIEETYSGHELVKVFGRTRRCRQRSMRRTRSCGTSATARSSSAAW